MKYPTLFLYFIGNFYFCNGSALTNEQKESEAYSSQQPTILAPLFPTPYECALLSKHVYRDEVKVGDELTLALDAKNPQKVTKFPQWKLCEILPRKENTLSILFKALGLDYDYRGMIYCNDAHKQLVFAHRGTQPKNIDSLKTDAFSIVMNQIGGQERLLPSLLKTFLVATRKKKGYSLTFTGHSLGGWLAQVMLFIAVEQDRDKKYHFKAITFEAPGVRPMLTQINRQVNPIDLDADLDITSYLSSPNLVNTVNPHVGTLYRIVFKEFSNLSPVKYTLQSHKIIHCIHALDPKNTKPLIHEILDWPLLYFYKINATGKNMKDILSFTDLNLLKKIKTIFKPLFLLTDKKLLGKYSGFLKFSDLLVKRHYDIKQLTLKRSEEFELVYKYHYNTQPYDYRKLHSRHLSYKAYKVLETKYSREQKYKIPLQRHGLGHLIKANYENQHTGMCITLKTENIHNSISTLNTLLQSVNLAEWAKNEHFLESKSLVEEPIRQIHSSTVFKKDNETLDKKYEKVFDIESFHVSCDSDKPNKWLGDKNLGGIILFQYFGKKDWYCNGVHCKSGYIIVKKIQNLKNIYSRYGQIHGRVYRSVFKKEFDPKNIQGAGFAYDAKKKVWKYNSWTLNSPFRKEDKYHDEKKGMNDEQIEALEETLKMWIKTGKQNYNIKDKKIALYKNKDYEEEGCIIL